jgi:curli biogenesis system outer membrane secretion channel CsgG
MKKTSFASCSLLAILAGSLLFGIAAFSFAQDEKPQKPAPKLKVDLPPYTGPKKRLGVLDVEIKVSPQGSVGTSTSGGIDAPAITDFGTGLTEMLTTALVESKRFVVLERKAMMDINQEQASGTGAAFDQSSSAKAGKMLGAQAIIRGSVTEYSYRRSATSGAGLLDKVGGLQGAKNEAVVVLDIRIVDTQTGQILDSVKAEGRAKASAQKLDLKIGSESEPLAEAARKALSEAVKAICARMEKMPWEARVSEMDKDGETVSSLYVNAGSLMGVKEGDEFEIYHPGRDIVDADTKTIIGRTKDSFVGTAIVESVTEKLAILKPASGKGFEKNDVVRFKATPKKLEVKS